MANKSILRHTIGKCLMNMALMAILMTMAGTAIQAYADDADVPAITLFYPGKNDESPMELKPGVKAYVYFQPGSKVLTAKANVEQDGTTLGTIEFVGRAGGSSDLVMDPSKSENAAMNDIKPGLFKFVFYEATYIADGVEMTYSDTTAPINTVTYLRKIPNGKIVSSTGLEDRTVLSYYDPEGTDGVRTYTFDRPVIKDNIQAYFEYGQLNTYIITPINWTINDDGTVLTVDLRGICYNVDALAPGVTFVDEMGKPLPPPTDISINVSGLNCVDGTQIEMDTYSLDGVHSAHVTGRIYESYYYTDLTFPTPVLAKAEFYAKANPAVRYGSINEATDMMDLKVLNAKYIKTADMTLDTDEGHVTIAAADIKISGETYTVELPEAVISAGSDNLMVSLINVVYKEEDGATHKIQPLTFGNVDRGITKLADLKDVEAGTTVTLNIAEGIKVTMSNEAGYTFAEDSTAGIQIVTDDYSKLFDEGVIINGTLKGTYEGYGLFMVDPKESSYTTADTDVTLGTIVENITDLTSERYHNCLVTIKASEYFDIVYDEDYEMIMINSYLPVMTDFIEEEVNIKTIENVTGIVYYEPNLSQTLFIVRSLADFNQELPTNGMLDEVTGSKAQQGVYDMRGVKMSDDINQLNRGIYIVNGKKMLIK